MYDCYMKFREVKPVSALMLRIIACVAMLIDHIGFQYNIMAFRAVGRIAFPIFAYLIGNGFRHTSNRGRYALRLAAFALISQVPFSLFAYRILWHSNGNVFFTLLLALVSIWAAEELGKRRELRWAALIPAGMICVAYHIGIMSSDYGARGILLALVFYYFDGKTILNRLAMAVGMLLSTYYAYILRLGRACLLCLRGAGFQLPSLSKWDGYQIFALLALIFIFCYNGKKGQYPTGKWQAKAMQLGFYLFYPVHQLVLWILLFL